MLVLKKLKEDISKQCIVNCFRKAECRKESQEYIINKADNPFVGRFVDGVDDNLEDFEFSLNQLGELNPNPALEQVKIATMIDEDANALTDSSKTMTLE